jgi:RimJ/RimL family protein N-acetyltransferase
VPVPVVLRGRAVQLEPLTDAHVPGLARAAALDRSSYLFTPVPHGIAEAAEYVTEALVAQASGRALVFATVRLTDGVVVGSTRFCELDYWQGPVTWPPRPTGPMGDPQSAVPDAAEIGGTWLSPEAQGTGINAEAKLLMLSHAFEVWGVQRIAMRADARNLRSRRAIERIGASLDGVHRAHSRGLDGQVRATAFYSILADEWPEVREHLRQRALPMVPA